MSQTLRGVDLNLLVALDALLREQSVTRAAEALGLSQPSLSASLARLRRHFGDALLVREGNRLVPTPFAIRLREQVEMSVAEASKVFSRQRRFDPAASSREFRIVVSDYGGVIGVPELSRALSAQAEAAVVRTVHISLDFVAGVPESLRSVDAMVLPHGAVGRMPHRDLYLDRWVCVMDAANPKASATLTPQVLGELPWVVPFDATLAFTSVVNQLRAMDVVLRAQAVVQTFLSVPALVAGTDRVALLQERLALRVADSWGLTVVELPIQAAPIVQALWWHPIHQDDQEHRWFRELEIDGPEPRPG